MFTVFKKKQGEDSFIEEELISSLKDDEINISDYRINKARKGNDKEIYGIGEIYFQKKNYPKALAWFHKAAIKENRAAQNQIGFSYHYGLGVSVDYRLAMEWYLKAANNGNPTSQNNIGNLYRNGQGVNVDYKLAMEWFIKSKTDASFNNIATLYRDGLGVDVDYKLAMKWYHKASVVGFAQATSNVGWMYHNGYGVPIDYVVSMRWYRKAIERGYLEAYTRVGLLYKYGLGIPKDLHFALKCFYKAANTTSDDAECQYQLAFFFEKQEPYKNKKLAIEWYTKASNRGYKKAKEALDQITKEENYKDEEKIKSKFPQNLKNRPIPEITSDFNRGESSSRNNSVGSVQNDEHMNSLLTEEFNVLDQRIDESEKTHQKNIQEMNKAATESDDKMKELEEMLERSKMEFDLLHQKRWDNSNRSNMHNAIPINTTNTNIAVEDDNQDLNYDTPDVSDNEDAASDINYDTENDSDSESISSVRNDLNYDSEDDQNK